MHVCIAYRTRKQQTEYFENVSLDSYCIWSVVSQILKLNRSSICLRLFCHESLNSDQLDWDWNTRLNEVEGHFICIGAIRQSTLSLDSFIRLALILQYSLERVLQPIAFGVSFLHSQISIDDLVLQVSFTTFA